MDTHWQPGQVSEWSLKHYVLSITLRRLLDPEDHPLEWLLKTAKPGVYDALLVWLREIIPDFPDPKDFNLPVARLSYRIKRIQWLENRSLRISISRLQSFKR